MSNFSIIAGVVAREPHMEHGAICIDLNILRTDLNKTEKLSIYSYNKDIIKRCILNVKEDYFFYTSNASLHTCGFINSKELVCSECHSVNYKDVNSERSEIVFEDFSCFPIEESEVKRIPGINKVLLQGNICSELNYRISPVIVGRQTVNKSYLKYKLGVNKYTYSTESDYPFIVSFGKEADLAHQHLKKGARVLVEGSIQERVFKQDVDFTCPACGCHAIKKIGCTVREVIANNVAFLDKEPHYSREMLEKMGVLDNVSEK